MSAGKMHVKKDDMVVVIAGKDKGKSGKVVRVFSDRGKVVVEGINMVKRHVRPNRLNTQGGIIEKEAALSGANVMLLCGACNKTSRTGKRLLADGTKVRFCKKCNEIVDK